MILGAHRASADLCSLEPGTHLCALESEVHLDRIAATFVGQGLAAGDRLLYVAPDEHVDTLLRMLPPSVHARDALDSGQLLVSSFADAYGVRRPDDLGTIAEGFRAAAGEARKSGFPALRVAARMDELEPFLGSIDEVVLWERMATTLQRELGVSSVCLYDSGLLDHGHGALIAREHAGMAPDLDDPPIATFLAVDEPWGLRVSGELDVSNRDLLHRTVLSRAQVSPRVRLDLGGLTFADVGAVHRLRSVAAALPDSGWLALDSVPTVVRRILDVTGLRHERLKLEP